MHHRGLSSGHLLLGLLLLGLTSCQDSRADKAYVQGDYSKAVTELRDLAERGEARAQYDLGLLYDRGEGVRRNPKEAMRWYYLAAEQGDIRAQYNLGLLYADGEGIPQNYSEAYFWINLAATHGSQHAVEARAFLAGKMSPAQMAEAERLARARKGLVDKEPGCQLCPLRPSGMSP